MSLLGLFDYPKEIRQLKSQIPSKERDAFLSSYKKLSKNDKVSFKEALRNADIDVANKILGKDLNQYHVTLNKQTTKTNDKTITANKGVKDTAALTNTPTANQINGKQIIPAIIPAEAARRYAAYSDPMSSTSGTFATPTAPANWLVRSAPATAITRLSSTMTPSANETKIYRIDSSGIFAIPDEISSDNIKSVLVNGKPIGQDKYAITENGNVDIFEAEKDSSVSIVL